jgi:hypothetical protein
MPRPGGCEPKISTSEGPYTNVLDRAATGIGTDRTLYNTARSERRCALTKVVGSDVHECLYRSKLKLN